MTAGLAGTRTLGCMALTACPALVRYARRNARRTGGRTGVATRAPLAEPQTLETPRRAAVAAPPVPANA